jgi:hypothetical protein
LGKIDRLTDKYFGEYISTILENKDMPPAAKQKIENNFCTGLQRAVSYLQQWFEFSDTSIAFVLQSLSLI